MNPLLISHDIRLPLDMATQTAAILGIRGSGKTSTGVVITEELLDARQQVVVIDPLNVWWGLRSSVDGKRDGYQVIVLGGDHGDLPLEASSGRVVAECVVRKRVPLVLSLRHLSKNGTRQFVTDFAEALYELKGQPDFKHPLHLMIDEADMFAPQKVFAGNERMFGAIDQLVRRGRSSGIGVTLISQRAAVLNKDVLTQVEMMVCHRTVSPQDRKAIEAWVEVHDAEGVADRVLQTLHSQLLGQAWIWSPGWMGILQQTQVRPKKTFDSSATPKAGRAPAIPKTLAVVDLDALRDEMQATVEQAEKNDPKALRRRITELEKLLTVAESVKTAPAPVPIPVLDDEDRRKIGRVGELCATTLDTFQAECAKVHDSIDDMRLLVSTLLSKVGGFADSTRKTPTRTPPEARRSFPHVGGLPLAPSLVKSLTGIERADLSKAERLIITAAVQRHPKPSSRAQLALLSGYSIKSSSFANALGGLRSKGLISGAGDNNIVTGDGIGAVGEVAPLPTGMELVGYWCSKLSKAEREILMAVAEHPLRGLTKEEISTATGYSIRSSSFANALGKLRTLELVERGEPVRLSPDLM